MSYRGAVPVLYGGLRLEFQVEGSSRNLKPEENILRSRYGDEPDTLPEADETGKEE